MLERATACLDSGARLSATCAKRAPRSRRALHSQFWNHGAGDLDLPPYAISMKSPSQWPVNRDRNKSLHPRKKATSVVEPLPTPEAPFLDFLYPPQTLAWLHRSNGQSMERWEKRNARRLPEGFIQASRGYASRSVARSQPTEKVNEEAVEEDMEKDVDSEIGQTNVTEYTERQRRKHQARDFGRKVHDGRRLPASHQWLATELELLRISGKGGDKRARELVKQLEISDEMENVGGSPFGDSPGDLAELPQYDHEPPPQANTDSTILSKEPYPDVGSERDLSEHIDILPHRREAPSAKTLMTASQRIYRLKVLLTYRNLPRMKRRFRDRPRSKRAILTEAWNLYDSLPQDMKTSALTNDMMLLYSTVRRPSGLLKADKTVRVLFRSVPPEDRTLDIYQARLETIVRKSGSSGFWEVLLLLRESLLDTMVGPEIIKGYFLFFIHRGEFRKALGVWRTAHSCSPTAITTIEEDVVAALSESPFILDFARYLRKRYTISSFRHAKGHYLLRLCNSIYWQALRSALTGQKYAGGSENVDALVKSMFRHLRERDTDWLRSTEALLQIPLTAEQHLTWASAQRVTSIAYRAYLDFFDMTSVGQRPREEFFYSSLGKAQTFAANSLITESSQTILSINEVLADWKRFYISLPIRAVKRLMSFFARDGDYKAVHYWKTYLQRVHNDKAADFWTLEKSIYVHAQRGELDKAKHAFERAAAQAKESGRKLNSSAWNILIHAHAKADDVAGSLELLQRMSTSSGHIPDHYSFGPVLMLLAARGDVSSTEDLLEQYDQLCGSPRDTVMMTSLLSAHINSGNLPAAEPLLREILRDVRAGKVFGPMTDCFNLLLTHYALDRDINRAMATFRWMAAEEIPQNGKTFSALMQALTVYRQTDAARKILTDVMPSRDLRPTSFHYAIVIAGYNNQGMYEEALQLGEHMRQINVRPSMSTDAALRKAEVLGQYHRSNRATDATLEDETLDMLLKQAEDAMELSDVSSQRQPMPGEILPRNVASAIAAKYDFAIFLHGKRKMFKAVQRTLASYKAELKVHDIDIPVLPMRILTALMSAYLNAAEYEQVEECWRLLKSSADELTKPATVPNLSSSEEDAFRAFAKVPATGHMPRGDGKKPVPGRRYILSRPLRFVLQARAAQQQLGPAIQLVSRLLIEGYTLDNSTWNAFIQQLCKAEPPLALLAFVLMERFLIPNWPGWKDKWLLADPLKPSEVQQGLQYIRARYLRPGQLLPLYKTMVYLAQSLLEVRRVQGASGFESDQDSNGRKRETGLDAYVGTLKQIRERAPRTLKAVQDMPRIEGDWWQQKLIRKEV